jgi:hypothetical protein
MSTISLTHPDCRHSDRRSLYTTAAAMFLGLLGVVFFQAPGGVIGSLVGALAGYALGFRSKPEA